MTRLRMSELIENKINPSTISDAQIENSSYGIKYFELYGNTAREDLIYWKETQKILLDRLAKIEAAKISAPRPQTQPRCLTQLWEPCECCGEQPCYLELNHKCKKCG